MYLSRMNSSRTLSCASGAILRPSGSAASHTLRAAAPPPPNRPRQAALKGVRQQG
jgi:hypothetical protein